MNQHPTVVISGGSSGLGKAIGLEAAKQGATVGTFWRGGGR
ncbi:Ketoacyl reductase, partial [Lacticaseibacillus paracasei subsp. paracasei Lpp14]